MIVEVSMRPGPLPSASDSAARAVRPALAALALGLLTAPACSEDLGLTSRVFACQTDADCAGLVCHPQAKVCVTSSDADVAGLLAGADAQTDAGADAGPIAEPATCAAYCATVLTACGTEAPLGAFPNQESCRTYCEVAFSDEPGSPGGHLGQTSDDAVDTIGCRLNHARQALRGGPARAAHCLAAGASGGDTCGQWCDAYCDAELAICDTFANDDACRAACGALNTGGTPRDSVGDTVQCRLYHLSLAAISGDTAMHCGHAQPDSTMFCSQPAPQPPACDDYCDTVTVACKGPLAQYADWTTCHTACEAAAWPAGTSWQAGDSLGCRVTQAEAALTNPGDHCEAAGVSGGGYCGSWCGAYCALYGAICQDAVPQATGDNCVESCLSVPDGGPAEVPGGTGPTGADTIQCRLGVLQAVATGVPQATTCDGAALDSSPTCTQPAPTPSCQGWCESLVGACAGESSPWAASAGASCESWCQAAGLKPGELQDFGRNTLGCRAHYANAAATAPAPRDCAIAGPWGGGVCGDRCEVYCDLFDALCGQQPVAYKDRAACLETCAAFRQDGDPKSYSGDTVQCRVRHLTAVTSPAAAQTHCPHASADGAGTCVDATP